MRQKLIPRYLEHNNAWADAFIECVHIPIGQDLQHRQQALQQMTDSYHAAYQLTLRMQEEGLTHENSPEYQLIREFLAQLQEFLWPHR